MNSLFWHLAFFGAIAAAILSVKLVAKVFATSFHITCQKRQNRNRRPEVRFRPGRILPLPGHSVPVFDFSTFCGPD
jgi:hypothetical protein